MSHFDFFELELPGVIVLKPSIFRDERGFLSETYSEALLFRAGIDQSFVQENHVLSTKEGVVRGLHFQIEPSAQGKLVRVVRGSILDVAVDIRVGSPTYGRHIKREISAENWEQIWIPAGFAHGYCTMLPDTEVIYKVTNLYDPGTERSILFDDPALGIDWPYDRFSSILSDKDLLSRPLAEHPPYFHYDEAEPLS